MKLLTDDDQAVELNPDPTGWSAIAEIDGERHIAHLTLVRIGAAPAVTPAKARLVSL